MSDAIHKRFKTKQWKNSRSIAKRIFVSGKLVLTTPAGLGNGDSDGATDISLMLDATDGSPILTGTSLAGAIRNYLLEAEQGFGTEESKAGTDVCQRLFGHVAKNAANDTAYTAESWLMIDDALGAMPPDASFEYRDGVTIDPKTGTAEAGKLYDYELLPAKTTFDVSFELWLPQSASEENESEKLLQAFADGLDALASGEIGLGLRKSRGLGRCKLADEGWTVHEYDMGVPADIIDWLSLDGTAKTGSNIHQLLDVKQGVHKGEQFVIDATFSLRTSLLIRSVSSDPNDPEDVYLRSARKEGERPIVSGTSLAGAIRGRALRIAQTVDPQAGGELVDLMFGKRIQGNTDTPSGSKIMIEESVIDETKAILDRVQNRVKIDRFTSGAFPTALFSQQPLFAHADGATQVKLNFALRKVENDSPEIFKKQIHLILQVVKDLWSSDLPLGGEKSVGRGRLSGKHATFTYRRPGTESGSMDEKTWEIKAKDDQGAGHLEFIQGSPSSLNELVAE